MWQILKHVTHLSPHDATRRFRISHREPTRPFVTTSAWVKSLRAWPYFYRIAECLVDWIIQRAAESLVDCFGGIGAYSETSSMGGTLHWLLRLSGWYGGQYCGEWSYTITVLARIFVCTVVLSESHEKRKLDVFIIMVIIFTLNVFLKGVFGLNLWHCRRLLFYLKSIFRL